RRRVGRRQDAPGDLGLHPLRARPEPDRAPVRAVEPRTDGRARLPGRAPRRRDPAPGADRARSGRVRRAHERAAVPAREASARRAGGEAPACPGGAATTAPRMVVRQSVEPTPKARPWYSRSACWWIDVVITTSVKPFATPKAASRASAASALPDQAKARKRQPIAP